MNENKASIPCNKILIIGLGLIGGSYAQSLTEKGYEVGAIDTNFESLKLAFENGWIRHGMAANDVACGVDSLSWQEYIGSFDLLIFALYPHTFLQWIRDNMTYIKENALITDVTGVKSCVVYEVQSLLAQNRKDLEYIGAHPMAGREQSGIEFADKNIFIGANYIVTPTPDNTQRAKQICADLGRVLGFSTITELSPDEHDEMIGFLSQLTHCIAVALMTCRDTTSFAEYTGDSFRDLTRIAKINDEMWSELFVRNKDALLKQMDLFENSFNNLRDLIKEDKIEEMRDMMRLSTCRRKRFDYTC